MPELTNFAELRDTLNGAGPEQYLRAFGFFASPTIRAPATYVCWQCLEQHKRAPNKRKAVFIFDTFMVPAVKGAGLAGTILDGVHLGGGPAAFDDGLTAIRRVFGKLVHCNMTERHKMPSPEVFRTLAVLLAYGIDRLLEVAAFDTESDYTPDTDYTTSIPTSRELLTAAGFDADAMGVVTPVTAD